MGNKPTPWPPPECPTCGHPDPSEGGKKCGGHLANPGDRPPHCRLGAGTKTDHVGYGRCRYHGGAHQAGREHGRRAMLVAQEAELEANLRDWGYDPVDDPTAVLADLAGMARAMVDWWAARMAELADFRFTDDKGAEQLRSEVALHERAMDRAAKFAIEIAKLDLDERRVRVEEVQAAALIELMRRVFDSPAAQLKPSQRAVLLDALHDEVAALEAGGEDDDHHRPAPTGR